MPVLSAKRLAAIDTVRVGKTGYNPVKIPIESYTADIGTVTLTAKDIEGQVTTLFNSMNQTQRLGQLAMPSLEGNNPSGATMVSNNVGSVFGGGGALSGRDASSFASYANGVQNALMGATLKIPALFGFDFVHGASALPGAVIFPHNMGMGAIKDTMLIQKAYRVTALEMRGCGANWTFAPCIAVIRDDRWGRAYEGFSESTALNQLLARQAVLGLQTTDLSLPTAVAATAKHFAGDGNTTNGVNPGQTEGPDATARAINLPPYASAVSVGVACVMPSFSKWCDGTPMHQNKTLMMGWLKSTATGNPGFMGFIVGDWEAAWPLNTCVDAGVDVPMAPGTGINIIGQFNDIYSSLSARIDDAVKRVLRVKCWMNLFAPENYLVNSSLTSLVGCAEHRDVARACVRASLVLLKHQNNVLPIPKSATVAIIGNGGNDIGIQCGGWTVSWQGSTGTPTSGGTTIYQGMQALATNANNVTFTASPTSVPNADYIVAVLSEDPYAETSFPNVAITGNKASSSNQNVINQAVAAKTAGKKVIGILMAGRPLDISGIINSCDAFIWASLPGTEGKGIAEMLYRDKPEYQFTGKLQVTWPKNATDEPINDGDGKTGLFPFGHGLTY
jgi:beta-glucosidase